MTDNKTVFEKTRERISYYRDKYCQDTHDQEESLKSLEKDHMMTQYLFQHIRQRDPIEKNKINTQHAYIYRLVSDLQESIVDEYKTIERQIVTNRQRCHDFDSLSTLLSEKTG